MGKHRLSNEMSSHGQPAPRYRQTRQEERVNSLTHGLMAFLVVVLLPFALINTYRRVHGSPPGAVASVAIFCFSLILMFGTSAIYHGLPQENRYKSLLNRLDHIAIYITIAGAYTPISLVVIGGTTGWLVLALEWSLVLIGVLFKIFAFRKSRINAILSTIFYLLMGWVILPFLPVFVRKAQLACSLLIAAGGLFYSTGVFFYARQKRFSHIIWHLFVDAGATCHFLAIVFFLNAIQD
jgi:hemolysin III